MQVWAWSCVLLCKEIRKWEQECSPSLGNKSREFSQHTHFCTDKVRTLLLWTSLPWRLKWCQSSLELSIEILRHTHLPCCKWGLPTLPKLTGTLLWFKLTGSMHILTTVWSIIVNCCCFHCGCNCCLILFLGCWWCSWTLVDSHLHYKPFLTLTALCVHFIIFSQYTFVVINPFVLWNIL